MTRALVCEEPPDVDDARTCPLCGQRLDAFGRCPDSAWHDTDLYGPDDLHDWGDV